MNLDKLARTVADKTGIAIATSTAVIESALGQIKEAVASNDEVKLCKFGVFSRGHRDQRSGRNPSTGEVIEIPATYTVKFKASQDFKDAVKQ